MSDPGRPSSPLSPGRSVYDDTVPAHPFHEPLLGDARTDVAIVGGGYTGLSAAIALVEAGVSVTLLEANRLGDGASGRNGGQFGTGQRNSVLDLEQDLGFERAKALFDLAEDAKRHVRGFAEEHAIDIEYGAGQLSLVHKPRLLAAYAEEVDALNLRYGYPDVAFMDSRETAERLGSREYMGGIRDTGTGHIHPLKWLLGLGSVAAATGVRLHEQSRVAAIERADGRLLLRTAQGTLSAERVLLATNAHGVGLDEEADAHVLPIRSFMGATEPLAEPARVLPGGEAADDSRFVVRYFRKSADNRLLFGGREAYTNADGPIEPTIRRQIASIYPHLKDVRILHAWGGSVAVTRSRLPFVRVTQPGVTYIGGYSGHGVLMSNLLGRLYARKITGQGDAMEAFEALRQPRFPGGTRWRSSLLLGAMTWFSIRDRL